MKIKMFMATCPECDMVLPFKDWERRDEWLKEHTKGTGIDGKRHTSFILAETPLIEVER